ncbi:MAG: tail fiber protein, partial [Pseudomonadota bacterium]
SSHASAQCIIGEVKWSGFNFEQRGWAKADGRLLQVSQYTALFSIYGTTYGGDGRTTFGLPDLRSRVAMHAGNGPGLTPRRLGQKLGAETVILTASNIGAHTHAATTTTVLKGSSDAGDNPTPTGRVLANDGGDRIYRAGPADQNMGADAIASSTTITPSAGGNTPINIVQPSLALNPLVCLEGVYPSRS